MMRTLLTRRRRVASPRGMTLLEIMIVVAILGLIASVVVVGVMNSFERARISASRLKVGQILQALDMYRANEGDYPAARRTSRTRTSRRTSGVRSSSTSTPPATAAAAPR